VQPGDLVREDQPLVDVMTDKATVTIPSAVSGRVVNRSGNVGGVVAVGSDLVRFETDSGKPVGPRLLTTQHAMEGASAAPGLSQVIDMPAREATSGQDANRSYVPLASPTVRRRAMDAEVDLADVVGSGSRGRIVDSDIDDFIASDRQLAEPASDLRPKRTGKTEIPLGGLRRRIADKMVLSARHIPHFTYIEEVDITELAKLRDHLNQQRSAEKPKVTYLPLIMLALVKALRKHPQLNSHYDDEREIITQYDAVHLGIATQTDRGLYVPVVRHVETMDVWQATREMRRLAETTKDNTVSREELSGSTFTVSSLGPLGGLAATPIINPPEVAILAIHKAEDRPIVRDGEIVIRRMMNLSASFDHRVIDGADGALLIQALKAHLENPATIFIPST
jgi:2-oxoisovalerate dehydrogenase E2 component (dihydrolipoyl transacylase)